MFPCDHQPDSCGDYGNTSYSKRPINSNSSKVHEELWSSQLHSSSVPNRQWPLFRQNPFPTVERLCVDKIRYRSAACHRYCNETVKPRWLIGPWEGVHYSQHSMGSWNGGGRFSNTLCTVMGDTTKQKTLNVLYLEFQTLWYKNDHNVLYAN